MKVLDLQCDAGHGFEGWFASEADYEQQHAQGRIECPICGISRIVRRPSAPRLNLSGAKAPAEPRADAPGPSSLDPQRAARWAEAVGELMRNTEDVGDRFPEEARRIHYGEVPPKGIRGQATPRERAELQEEGIETVAFPMPAVPKRMLQ
jgi:hypothetical protein